MLVKAQTFGAELGTVVDSRMSITWQTYSSRKRTNDHRRKLRVSGKQNLLTYEQSFGNSEQDNLSFHKLNSFTVSISSK